MLGAHMSIAGGVSQALLRGEELGCQAVQLFVKNNLQWFSPSLTADEVGKFKNNLQQTEIKIAFAHACYLINLATPDEGIFKRSCDCLLEEYTRCERLGLPYITFHPGSHQGAGEEFGLQRVAQALNWLFSQRCEARVKVLLETTSGQGFQIGYQFDHLRKIQSLVEDRKRLGVCLDTCHIFSAGYDIRVPTVYEQTLKKFDEIVGLENLFVVHLNDSKYPLGSRHDRHEHIGKGALGLKAFRFLLNDKRVAHLPMVIETPKEDGSKMDIKNLNLLRSLLTD